MAKVWNFNPPAAWFEWKYGLRYQPRVYYPATLIHMHGEWTYWMMTIKGYWKKYRKRPREGFDGRKARWRDRNW